MTRHDFAFCGAGLAAVYVLAEGGGELRLAEVAGTAGGKYVLPSTVAVDGRSPAADAFRAARPLWLTPGELAARDAGRTGAGNAPGPWPAAYSLGALPLGGGTTALGCLLVAGDVGAGFDADRRGLLELYADQVAAGLESAAARPADRPGAPVPGRSLVPRHGGAFTLALGSGALVADERTQALFGLSARDFDGRVESLLACAVPDDVPALMQVLEPGRTTADDGQLAFRVRLPGGELRWLGLRCRLRHGPDGTPERLLGVVADAAYLRPTADEVAVVQDLAAKLAGATTVREVSRLVVAALRGPLDASRIALAELKAERLFVTVLDPPEHHAWPPAWQSEWRSEWPDASYHALPTLQNAMRHGHLGLWPSGAGLEESLAGIGPGGLAVLPLPSEGRTVGVCLVGWDTPHTFAPEERSLLTAAAGLVGQALTRAHALDAGHELATMLQRSLLPRKLPPLPGGVAVARYLPATRGLEVGGDWYDVIPLGEGHVALVIGDVQGHSAAAATIMGQMRTAVRAYAVEGHPPDVVVARANRLLVGMETDLFATCLYADLDMEEGVARFVRAGHLPPLLRQPDGATQALEVEGGPPLGVLADARFPMTEAGLVPGTLVALLTDGLVESSQLTLDEGMRRVREVVAAADPSDPGRVADEMLGTADGRDDDVAVLVLRYDGSRSRPLRTHWTVWRLPDAVMHARRFTARTLRSWGVREEADAALLVVSELVTNAIAHTRGEVRLHLALSSDRLRVAVSDASPRSPVKPQVEWDSTGGRGLLIVEATTSAWGAVPLSGGKQVWAEIPVDRGEPVEPVDRGESVDRGEPPAVR
ncbi:SpoIIE family protein phosphatase [Streptomyces genisteinicus]|uniref:protein-serine/threonine phosphatase n=1 Tax=Streptomyces genisteinicus TaxID=2768068 RepID=A0A7H0I131_9ACTN|nr:SpoIIE family protein phosphatase [Streptomyces genisteinicus]QNP66497.1 SpoIIE family protein phosphatase [Streptomyces genisteinicus]